MSEDNIEIGEPGVDDECVVEGVIKWFDPKKGYGFLNVNPDDMDVLIHHTILRKAGHGTIYAGAHVKCMAIKNAEAWRATQILVVDNTNAHIPIETPKPTKIMASIEEIGQIESVEIKWFDRIKGYGFAYSEELGEDIFLHMETLRNSGIEDIKPGIMVKLSYGKGPKGLMATRVEDVDCK